MNHSENDIVKSFPVISRITGVILFIISIWAAIEWNKATDSYWGFAYLLFALPGVFLFIIKAIKNKK